MGFKCKECGMELPDKEHLERHKEVHGKKRKFVEAANIDKSGIF
jgi:hypothetical protein